MSEANGYAFRDPRPLGGAVVVWEYLYLAATIANLVGVGLEFQNLAGRSPAALPGPMDALQTVALVSMVTRLASVAVYLVAAFLFLKWVYRIVANARTLRPGMRATPGWAVGWFFVPIAFLWKPFEYFKEAWEVSHNPASPAQVFTPAILRWWWGLWLAAAITGNISGRLAFMDDSAGMQAASDVFEMLSDALTVPLILIITRIVRRLSARQYETHQNGSAAVFA
jgi:hypothetical protein